MRCHSDFSMEEGILNFKDTEHNSRKLAKSSTCTCFAALKNRLVYATKTFQLVQTPGASTDVQVSYFNIHVSVTTISHCLTLLLKVHNNNFISQLQQQFKDKRNSVYDTSELFLLQNSTIINLNTDQFQWYLHNMHLPHTVAVYIL